MSSSAAPHKILRVGVIQGGRIIEERHFRRRDDVTIGQDVRNTIVVPAPSLPASFPVFEHRGGQYALVFTDFMDGRVRLGDADLDFPTLRANGQATKRGNVWVLPIGEAAKGKVTLGEVTLLFQFVPPPKEAPRAELPKVVKGSFLASIDRFFLLTLAASLFLHFSGATCIIIRPRPIEPELTLDELPDRFARVLIPQQPERPKPVEVVDAAKDESEEKKEEVAKAQEKPSPAPRKELEEKVAKTGLLKVLGSIGTSGGAFEDVLGSGTGAADIAAALAGAGGVGVATADALAAGQRGGGAGTAVGIGDLGTAGGGKVDLGRKADAQISGRVRDAAPEVDSAEVDRDALGRYVRARVKSIVACYEKELKRNPSLKGKVVVTWAITPAGRSASVEIEENTMGSDAVSACIRTVIRSWVYPFKPESEVQVSYPFVFTPSS